MTDAPTRLSGREIYELAVRIGMAWRQLRRGAATGPLRDFLYRTDEGAVEQGQIDTLDTLAQQPSWRMSELAEALRVDPSTATRAVQRLVNSGLATRHSSEADGRVVEVQITPRGTAVHEAVAERRVEVMTHILGHYRPEELPVVADILERFANAVDEFVSTRKPV